MPTVSSNGIELEVEEFGEKDAPVVVLIMGLGMQLLAWPEPFCQRLAEAGYRVIRFDNRDCGLSHKCHGMKAPHIVKAAMLSRLGKSFPVPYTLDDMALDTIGLFDALGIEQAHIVGASMGGMIAQILAAKHSPRILTMTSIMSTSGHPSYSTPSPKAAKQLFFSRPKSRDIEDILDYSLKVWEVIGSPKYPVDPVTLRTQIRRSVERSSYPQGFLRQLTAILASGSRRRLLQQIEVPTLVIHGNQDPLVPLAGGQDTAAHIPGARLEVIDGMGHNIPPQLHTSITDMLLRHFQHA